MLLQGKNVIITGTRRGIGRAMIEEFARNGAHIWAHARQETPEFLADMAETSRSDYAEEKSQGKIGKKAGF